MSDPCAIYLRISLDPSGRQEAVTRQLADCERLMTLKGWTLYGEPYSDNSISAFDSDKQRPAYNRMVADYLDGRFNKIICWDLDRLTRQPRQLEDWIDYAVQRGLHLVTANGEADLSTDGGRMYARIKAAVARGEMERKSARQRYANAFRAEQGLPHTAGPRAFGYAPGGLEVIPAEAAALQWAAAQVLTGHSLQATAKTLTAQGFTGGSTTARKHSPTGITGRGLRYMLTSPRYVALRVYQGVVIGEGNWPAILDEITHRSLVTLLTDRQRNNGSGDRRGRTPVYLLSGGAAKCGPCGASLRAGTHHATHGYECRKHCAFGHREAMDAKVHRAVIALLSAPDVTEVLVPDSTEVLLKIRNEATAIRSRLEFLDEDFASGAWDHDLSKYRNIRSRMLTEVTDKEAQLLAGSGLQVLDGLTLGTSAIQHQWAKLDIVRQRAIISILLDVRLHSAGRARRWDAGRHCTVTPRVQLSALSGIQFQQSINP